MRLGILDQVPLHEEDTIEQTMEATKRLVVEAERLGYDRYWFAEHHNTNGLLSAAPELFLARMGEVTSRIRLGSGGILLPQYHPLKIAETFSTLAAFYPDRIELGIGNSPGGSERTRRALTDGADNAAADFPRLLDEVDGFLTDRLSSRHPYRIVKTTPRIKEQLPLSVLGLSPRSASLAAERGHGLVFGHFINPDKWEETLQTYRDEFVPIDGRTPNVIICVFVICAETAAEAESLARTQDAWIQGIRLGHSIVPSFSTTETKQWNEEQQRRIQNDRRRTIVGTPDEVAEALQELSDRYQTDQFLLINNAFDQQKRLRSYQLIAERLLR
ncbi:LLM class flavin-dependent oxidoreductase [Exiguobacterium artemiae]|uniref:LLM class flavin-dependent oxidoreductase n=1 Tax=Exiguobacterium artemiae TaxID=340145 RepID=UPI002964496D|nr:LLM class flavin-dependent oxidoreductase [Exiguobacterium sibiricum]MDW2885379.1 LLM class flavin-dependent oxidoreductase [Exiguobacterium sibiricum]